MQACATLLSLTEEGQSYNEFHSAIVKLLMAGSLYKPKADLANGKPSSLTAAAVIRHTFILTWRVLDCLPPSAEFFKDLSQDLGKQQVQVTVCRSTWISLFKSVLLFVEYMSCMLYVVWKSMRYKDKLTTHLLFELNTWTIPWRNNVTMYPKRTNNATNIGINSYSSCYSESKWVVALCCWQDPDLSRLLCSLKFVSKLGIANPDATFCESLKVNVFVSQLLF